MLRIIISIMHDINNEEKLFFLLFIKQFSSPLLESRIYLLIIFPQIYYLLLNRSEFQKTLKIIKNADVFDCFNMFEWGTNFLKFRY